MQQMRAHRSTKPGCELARGRHSAQPLRGFEHQHAAPGARQVGRTGQAVVAATDDDGIVMLRVLRARTHARALATSRSRARAALAPGAPMTPPPGCVLEPHKYRATT